jgi:hypothetical protein
VICGSTALPNGTIIAVAAHDATIAGIGEPRVDAIRVGLEKVELQLHLPLAWALRKPEMAAWTRETIW